MVEEHYPQPEEGHHFRSTDGLLTPAVVISKCPSGPAGWSRVLLCAIDLCLEAPGERFDKI